MVTLIQISTKLKLGLKKNNTKKKYIYILNNMASLIAWWHLQSYMTDTQKHTARVPYFLSHLKTYKSKLLTRLKGKKWMLIARISKQHIAPGRKVTWKGDFKLCGKVLEKLIVTFFLIF